MREVLQRLKEKEAFVRLFLKGETEYSIPGTVESFSSGLVEIVYNKKSSWVDIANILFVSEV